MEEPVKKQRTTQSRTDTTLTYIAIVLGVLGVLAYAVALIVWAFQCGNAGGAFIIPQNGFPVCVQGVR